MRADDRPKIPSDPPEKRLADAVAACFRKGIRLNDAAWHYINSTFCHPSAAELRTLLSDESHPEREPLLELIFFPDPDQQAALEPTIAQTAPAADAYDAVLFFLTRSPLIAPLFVPGESGSIAIAVPPWAAAAFLSRLHIEKKIDPRLVAAVKDFVPDLWQCRVGVALRNARFAQTEKKVRFLGHFFRETAAEENDFFEHDFWDMVEFLVGFLDEITDDIGIYQALTDRKRACFRSLHQAMQFTAQLARHNMETLMLRGVRAPHIDKDDMRRKMVMIDRICQAVFGRTEMIETDMIDTGVVEGVAGEDMFGDDTLWRTS